MRKYNSDRELCETYARKLSNGFYTVDLEGFSEACFNQNSESDLRYALNGGEDRSDCENWGITPEQWRIGIEAALAARLIVNNDDKI